MIRVETTIIRSCEDKSNNEALFNMAVLVVESSWVCYIPEVAYQVINSAQFFKARGGVIDKQWWGITKLIKLRYLDG